MAAMFRRPRPGGGRHPPPLAPSVSSFKPRAQWTSSGSSIFLYVNLPGFYRDQIEVRKDERTRIIQIQGQRPLSSQTRATFNESYRVPESCDMSPKLNTSFSHGLLTIEFPVVVQGKKPEKAVQDQGKIVRRPNKEESGGTGPNGSILGRKKPLDEEKLVGTSKEKPARMANEEEPKTYKSVVEGKRTVPRGSQEKMKEQEAKPTLVSKERAKEEKVIEGKGAVPRGSREKFEEKVKEQEAKPNLARKERAKEEEVIESKEAVKTSQQKTGQKLKEEDARSTPITGGSLKPKVHAREEKVIESKKEADMVKGKTGQKVDEKEIRTTPTIDGSLEPKVHAKAEKVVERKGDGEIGQKLTEEGKIGLEKKKEEKQTKPVVGDEARKTDKEIAATNRAEPELKSEERVERTAQDVNGNDKSKNGKNDEEMVGEKVSEGGIQERVKHKKVEEAGLAKETEDVKDNAEVAEPKKVDSDDPPMKEEATRGGEDREEIVEKSSESEKTGPLLVEEGQKKTDMDPPAVRGIGEESQKYDISLLNVGVAALVIMGFGAYVFVPLVKLF